jgi:hypothetical protein
MAATSDISIFQNSFLNSSGAHIYKTTDFATRYMQQIGEHRWFNAPSGTAGNAVTFTQAMTLDASGRLGIGTTNPAALLHINSSSGARFRIQSTASTFSLIDFFNDTTPRWTLGIDNTQTYGKLENRILGADAIRFYDSTNNVILNATAGNVGINTTNPSEKLEVNGNIKTASPTGGTAQPWKFGEATNTLYTATRTVKVEINGAL